MTSIIKHLDGSVLDHIGWGVPNVEIGIETLAELTGDDFIQQPRPDPTMYFSNGILRLGGDARFVEVIGPNPEYDGTHPFGEFLTGLSEPRLLFWYVAVESLDAFTAEIEQVGHEFASIEHVVPERAGMPEYRRGVVESDFPMTMPNIIEWIDQRDTSEPNDEAERLSSVQEFRIEHQEYETLRECFAELGIEQAVEHGHEPALELTLETPRGVVTLSGRDHPW